MGSWRTATRRSSTRPPAPSASSPPTPPSCSTCPTPPAPETRRPRGLSQTNKLLLFYKYFNFFFFFLSVCFAGRRGGRKGEYRCSVFLFLNCANLEPQSVCRVLDVSEGGSDPFKIRRLSAERQTEAEEQPLNLSTTANLTSILLFSEVLCSNNLALDKNWSEL